MANLTLPVLPLDDGVVLPGMVVPLELDPETPAAVDAARPRAPPAAGTERGAGAAGAAARRQVRGRRHAGDRGAGRPAARRRARPRCCAAVARARIGTGVTGPGAALWVEAERVEDRPARPTHGPRAGPRVQGARRSRSCSSAAPGRSIDSVSGSPIPRQLADTAGYAPYLTAEQKRELLETADVEPAAGAAARAGPASTWPSSRSTEKIRKDVREGMDKQQREFLLRQQLAAIRKELGE